MYIEFGVRPALNLEFKSFNLSSIRNPWDLKKAVKRANLSDLDSTLSSLRTNLQQQKSIYSVNVGKLFGKKKAEEAQRQIDYYNAEIKKAEQEKADLEAELKKLEAELKELEAQS